MVKAAKHLSEVEPDLDVYVYSFNTVPYKVVLSLLISCGVVGSVLFAFISFAKVLDAPQEDVAAVVGWIALFLVCLVLLRIGLHLQSLACQDWKRGSRINEAGTHLIWWDGPSPIATKSISIADIGYIWAGQKGEGPVELAVKDRSGEDIGFNKKYVHDPTKWAAAMERQFPHIYVRFVGYLPWRPNHKLVRDRSTAPPDF